MSADTQGAPPSFKEVVSVLYLAQHSPEAETDYVHFCALLSEKNIPWDIEDKRFLKEFQTLKENLAVRLGLNNEEGVARGADAAYSSALSKEELDGMVAGLEGAKRHIQENRQKTFDHTKERVDAYVARLKKQQAPLSSEQETALRSFADEAVQKAVREGSTIELSARLNELLKEEVFLPAEIQAAVQQAPELSNRLSKITEVALLSPDTLSKASLIEHCLQTPELDPALVADRLKGELEIEKAIALPEETAQTFLSRFESLNTQEKQLILKQAMESMQQGAGKPIDDIVNAIGGPQGKDALGNIADALLGRVAQEYQEKGSVGGRPVSSTPQLKEKIRQMEAELTKKSGGVINPEERTRVFFRKAAESAGINEKRIQEVVDQDNQLRSRLLQGARIYLESSSAKISASAPEYWRMVVLSGSEVWGTFLRGEAWKKTGGAIKDFARIIFSGAGQAATGAATQTAVKTAVGIGAKTAVGGPIGFFIGAGGAILEGIKKLFSFFQSGGILRRTPGQARAPGGPRPFYEDESWMIPLAIAGGILCLLYVNVMRGAYVRTSFVVEKKTFGSSGALSEENTGRGEPHGDTDADSYWRDALSKGQPSVPQEPPVDYCSKYPDDPLCHPTANPNAVWPVVSSKDSVSPYITQGPGGSWSHAGSIANSVDIGTPLQSLILSPVNGTVAKVFNGCTDNKGFAGNSCGGGYGNFIDILIKNDAAVPDGNTLRIAHLAYNSMPPLDKQVSKGDVVGRVGNTGNSTGPHIHFGFINTDTNTPSINVLFPTVIPPGCSNAQDCGYIKAVNP